MSSLTGEAARVAGRARALSRMESTAGVMRKTGTTTDGDGFEVDEWATVGTLPVRIDLGGSNDGGSRGITVAGLMFEEATGVGHVPYDADDRLSDTLAANDLLDVTGETSGVWRVVAPLAYDQKTARRMPIAEVPRPEEWD